MSTMVNHSGSRPLLLVFPFGLLSHYLRCLILCRHFKKYFDVRIAYNPAFSSFIEQEQVATFECHGLDSSQAIDAVKQFDFSWMNEPALTRVYLDQVNVLRQLSPVAVLGDYSPTLKMAAETASVFHISLINGYMSSHYAKFRKVSRTHPAYVFLKKLPQSMEGLFTKQGEAAAFRQLHKPFKRIRQKFALQKNEEYLKEFEGDTTLICDLKELFPQRNLPANYSIISPLYYVPLTHIPDIAGRLNPNKQTILASMGSTGDWEKLSFLNDPFYERYNIVATGDRMRVLKAPHIVHEDFVNIHDLFPFVDLMICHGGNGTIYQALLYKVPVLCKTSHCEQEWNVNALEENQLARDLDGIRYPHQYKEIIEEWIQKKGNLQFQTYSEKIQQQGFQLHDEIEEVSNTILKGQKALKNPEHSVDAA